MILAGVVRYILCNHQALLGRDHPDLKRRFRRRDRPFTIHGFDISPAIEKNSTPVELFENPFADHSRVFPDTAACHNGFRSAQNRQVRANILRAR